MDMKNRDIDPEPSINPIIKTKTNRNSVRSANKIQIQIYFSDRNGDIVKYYVLSPMPCLAQLARFEMKKNKSAVLVFSSLQNRGCKQVPLDSKPHFQIIIICLKETDCFMFKYFFPSHSFPRRSTRKIPT
jgi:hypothetical protein